MPVKILLADKSITIQKVVEMLFSGKEYEVVCVSDGETALAEAARVIPDVVLADVDLPRVDGYSFASRLKQNATSVQTPVVLMMSRDDVFDEARARQAGIIDKIAKPFESQDLIGKVKKALTAAPPRLGGLAPRAAAAPPRPGSTPAASPKPAAAPSAPRATVPSDIFGIIQEAPAKAGPRKPAAPSKESVYEVEPEVEVEEPLAREAQRALPVGEKAVEEMRAGLGLTGKPREAPKAPPEIVNFETLEMATEMAKEYMPPPPSPTAAPRREPRGGMPPDQTPAVSEEMLRSIAEETIARIAREVLEKVAWEVIPDLAERLIREEIERLKAGT